MNQMTPQQSEVDADETTLRQKAIVRFRAMCFWNLDPKTISTETAIRRLRLNGNREALELASRLESLRDAAR